MNKVVSFFISNFEVIICCMIVVIISIRLFISTIKQLENCFHIRCYCVIFCMCRSCLFKIFICIFSSVSIKIVIIIRTKYNFIVFQCPFIILNAFYCIINNVVKVKSFFLIVFSLDFFNAFCFDALLSFSCIESILFKCNTKNIFNIIEEVID